MIDNHGRTIDYVRLAITDRCNLRCNYCMPETFTDFLPKASLLSYEELFRLLRILSASGVKKLRFTGGEPFVRKDFMSFVEEVATAGLFERIHLTTNGVITAPYVQRLKAAGIAGVNLSLDTLNPQRFYEITHRKTFDKVMKTLDALLEHEIPTRINAVVLPEHNLKDLYELTEFTRNTPVEVRFIEEMPFNGSGKDPSGVWNYQRILLHLSERFNLSPLAYERNGTAMRYAIEGHAGNVGIIAAYSRTFCGTCNRLRISPKGDVKTCLYGRDVLSLFDLLRNNAPDEVITDALAAVVNQRFKTGFEAEEDLLKHETVHRSMVTIGG